MEQENIMSKRVKNFNGTQHFKSF